MRILEKIQQDNPDAIEGINKSISMYVYKYINVYKSVYISYK